MNSIRTVAAMSGLAVMCAAAGVAGQSATTEQKEKTKVEIKGGKEMTFAGCLERSVGDTKYVLTDEAGDLKYAIVTDDDLTKYVDHRVEVKGNAADHGDATVKIERKVEGTSGAKAESKVERKGDTAGIPYFGLKSIKSVASKCG